MKFRQIFKVVKKTDEEQIPVGTVLKKNEKYHLILTKTEEDRVPTVELDYGEKVQCFLSNRKTQFDTEAKEYYHYYFSPIVDAVLEIKGGKVEYFATVPTEILDDYYSKVRIERAPGAVVFINNNPIHIETKCFFDTTEYGKIYVKEIGLPYFGGDNELIIISYQK